MLIIQTLSLMLISTCLSFFGKFFFNDKKTMFGQSVANMFICWIFITFLFVDLVWNQNPKIPQYYDICTWVDLGSFTITWDLYIDSLSISMLFVVVSVSFLVHVYSCYYMYQDPAAHKFMSFITLFTFCMCVLVSSSNFVMLFFGWEGVGICSFLLISFWNTRVQANKSAIKAMLINRVGDFCLLIAIVLIAVTFKSVDFNTVFGLAHVYSFKFFINTNFINLSVLDVICLFLLIGAITKSAQFGMHGWLPDAMEGPTPVSALIHAATMVTAGVFLIIRCSFMFEFSHFSLTILVYLGSLTLFLFGLVAVTQFDIKKIIAYSTCSQLGYMILACGLSGYNLALFHLFTHAWFKALLFLSAGTIIHFMKGEQDIRKLTGLYNKMPFVSICFLIGSFSLIGLPHLSGYYSKDAIVALSRTYEENLVIYLSAVAGIALTTLYSLRIIYYLFYKTDFKRKSLMQSTYNYETNFFNVVPLFILSLMSIFSGFFFKTFFIGLANNTFYGSIFTICDRNYFYSETILSYLKHDIVIPTILITTFVSIYYVIDRNLCRSENENEFSYYFFSKDFFMFFNKRMFFDSLVNLFLVFGLYNLGYTLFYIFDKGLFELFGPRGAVLFYNYILKLFSKEIFNGQTTLYLYFIVGFYLLILILGYFCLF